MIGLIGELLDNIFIRLVGIVFSFSFVSRPLVPVRILAYSLERNMMIRMAGLVALFFVFVTWSSPSTAEYQTHRSPSAHELSQPLQANLTEPNFKFQFGFPISHMRIARIDVVDYLGIYLFNG